MHSKRCDDIMRANSGAAAVQLDLFFAANHSIEPGAYTVWVGCGWLRLAGWDILELARQQLEAAETRPESIS
jgi:hypothetical protein